MKTFLQSSLAALGLSVFAAGVMAQETVILSVCQDGLNGGASQTEAEMAKFLSGPWSMTAVGTGVTLGTNAMAVQLIHDEASGTLKMGGPGPSVTLHPVTYRTNDDGKEVDDTPFDMAIETLTPIGLDQLDIEVLTGCANPARYFWEFSSGGNKSWGALMFFDNDIATGFMANSAGGSRNVRLSR